MYFFTPFCRLCFITDPSLMRFSSKDENGVRLSEKMSTVFPSPNDDLPKWLCGDCYFHLNAAFEFHEFCSKAYRQLAKHQALLNPGNDVNKSNLNSKELRVVVRDCVLNPNPESTRYLNPPKSSSNQTTSVKNEKISSGCEKPTGISLKRKDAFQDEDGGSHKKRKIRFSDPLSNILTEKRSPVHDAITKPIIKSPTSVANGSRVINNINHFRNNSASVLTEENGFPGFAMASEGICIQKTKFKINFFEYITSQCALDRVNGMNSDSGTNLVQQNGELNSNMFSNNNVVFKKLYKQLESSVNDEKSAMSCCLCSKFYRDYKAFLDLQKTIILDK